MSGPYGQDWAFTATLFVLVAGLLAVTWVLEFISERRDKK